MKKINKIYHPATFIDSIVSLFVYCQHVYDLYGWCFYALQNKIEKKKL